MGDTKSPLNKQKRDSRGSLWSLESPETSPPSNIFGEIISAWSHNVELPELPKLIKQPGYTTPFQSLFRLVFQDAARTLTRPRPIAGIPCTRRRNEGIPFRNNNSKEARPDSRRAGAYKLIIIKSHSRRSDGKLMDRQPMVCEIAYATRKL